LQDETAAILTFQFIDLIDDAIFFSFSVKSIGPSTRSLYRRNIEKYHWQNPSSNTSCQRFGVLYMPTLRGFPELAFCTGSELWSPAPTFQIVLTILRTRYNTTPF